MSSDIETRLGHTFEDKSLLNLALTHRTYIEETRPGAAANLQSQQRLEFLGDAWLDAIVAKELYARHPGDAEGELTKRRAAIVDASALHAAGERLLSQADLKLGRGGAQEYRTNKKILADTIEALAGAIWLDGGHESVVLAWLDFNAQPTDYTSQANERHQKETKTPLPQPWYDAYGPDHQRTFTASLSALGVSVVGTGLTKKEAKADACQQWLASLGD